MLQQQSIERMKAMRLTGMAQLYHQTIEDQLYQDYTIDQYIGLLVDQEWEYRQNRRMNNLLKTANFRTPATISEIDYSTQRGLDKNVFERLANLSFLTKKENIIITGPTGVGKSFLAQALGHQACFQLHRVAYYTTKRLLDEVQLSKVQGTYHKLIHKIQKAQLLILEDFGLIPFDTLARQAMMDIVDYKYDQSSIIITSQIPTAKWHQLIGEGTIADAILDRIIHTAHRIQLKGESMRKQKNNISK